MGAWVRGWVVVGGPWGGEGVGMMSIQIRYRDWMDGGGMDAMQSE